VREALGQLPARLDHVDGLIEAGVLGGERATAADVQIAPQIRALSFFDDLRPLIEARAAGRLAQRLCADYAGRVPPLFGAEQLAPLRAG